MTRHHRVAAGCDSSHEITCPGGIAGNVVGTTAQACGLPEARQIRDDHARAREVRHDRFQPVVIAAQAMEEHHPMGCGVLAVDPVPRGAAAKCDLGQPHRDTSHRLRVRGQIRHHLGV